MKRLVLSLALGTLGLGAQPPVAPFHTEPTTIPVATGSSLGRLAATATGAAVAASVPDPAGTSIAVHRFSRGDGAWAKPVIVSHGRPGCVAPPEVSDDGKVMAVLWSEAAQGVLASFSPDAGQTWSAPRVVSTLASTHIALTVLPGRGFLAVWIASSPGRPGAAGSELLAARIGADPVDRADALVATDASPGSPLALQPLADGGAVLAYRSITSGDIHDCSFCRLHGDAWSAPRLISEDQWRGFDHVGAGPSLATDGGRIAAMWYTGADADPRFLVSASPDAGERFLMPLRVDTDSIHSEPAVALLHDGAALALWVGAAAGRDGLFLQLRRVSPDFALQPPVIIAPSLAKSGPWRISAVLTRDYAGGESEAEVLVMVTQDGAVAPLAYVIRVPESQLLASADTGCHCAPAPSELTGYAFRGEVVGPVHGGVRVSHGEIPGVLDEGVSAFQVDIALELALKPGTRLLGRIERQDGLWRLYDVRLLLDR